MRSILNANNYKYFQDLVRKEILQERVILNFTGRITFNAIDEKF